LSSVRRAATGDIHRAVGQEFVLNVDDILYFAPGIVGEFPRFCDEHGLEIVTASAANITTEDSSATTTATSDNGNKNIPVGSTKESLETADPALRMRLVCKMIGKKTKTAMHLQIMTLLAKNYLSYPTP
jgi:hypothetical protein